MSKIILAIMAPDKDAYSETFIHAHRNLNASIRYYYKNTLPTCLDGSGPLLSESLSETLLKRFQRRILEPTLSLEQFVLLESLKKEKVNVVLAEYGTTGAKIYSICKKLQLPLLVYFYGYDGTVKEILEKHKKIYQEVFKYSTFVLTVSHSLIEQLINLGCPEEKLIYNPFGAEKSFFKVEHSFYPRPRFIMIGRFVDKKAPYYTLLAFRQVVQYYPDAELIMAGDGILWSTCKNLISYFNLQKNVIMVGVVNQEQMRTYFSQSRAFVQHSITHDNGDMEGTPVVILQASAAGLPVVSTLHGGIPEVVVHGQTGLLSEEHDVDEMAKNLCYLLEYPDQALAMGRAARDRARAYTVENHMQTLNQAILRAAGLE